MSDVQQALPKDDPMMVAWEQWKASPEFANTKHWAEKGGAEYVDGCLWAAFIAGWAARKGNHNG